MIFQLFFIFIQTWLQLVYYFMYVYVTQTMQDEQAQTKHAQHTFREGAAYLTQTQEANAELSHLLLFFSFLILKKRRNK